MERDSQQIMVKWWNRNMAVCNEEIKMNFTGNQKECGREKHLVEIMQGFCLNCCLE